MFLKRKIVSIILGRSVKDLLIIFCEIFSKFMAVPEMVGLRVRKKTLLGDKNEIIYLPFDKYITWWVIKEGEYKHFFINSIKKTKQKIIFVDIGANTGLISKQVYNLKKEKADIYCFEPDSTNFQCLKLNVGAFAKCYNFGLSDKDKKKVLYKFNNNHGRSTLLKKRNFSKTENIFVKDINNQLKKIFIKKLKNTEVFIKFDTEGYDLFLISLLNNEILNKVDCICFEYQSLNNYPFNKKKLSNSLNYFNTIISENEKLIDYKEIINLSMKGQKDIIIRKSVF